MKRTKFLRNISGHATPSPVFHARSPNNPKELEFYWKNSHLNSKRPKSTNNYINILLFLLWQKWFKHYQEKKNRIRSLLSANTKIMYKNCWKFTKQALKHIYCVKHFFL